MYYYYYYYSNLKITLQHLLKITMGSLTSFKNIETVIIRIILLLKLIIRIILSLASSVETLKPS